MSPILLAQINAVAVEYSKHNENDDLSHDISHIDRVTRLALKIGKAEKADLEILEAAALLHDIARGQENNGEVRDHAQSGSILAKAILTRINFPTKKIDAVCHCILTHRSNPKFPALTLEAKILQDADKLDAIGAVDISRVIASKIQSKQYKGPIYVEAPYKDARDADMSAIHYMIYKINEPKRQPQNFNTTLGKSLASERYQFMQEFVDRFIKEWQGLI